MFSMRHALNSEINKENFLESIEKKYRLKEIELSDIHNYFEEYKEDITLIKVTEGFIESSDCLKIYLKDASSENPFLDPEERKYELYILSFEGDKLVDYFYVIKFDGNSDLLDDVSKYYEISKQCKL